MKDYKFQTDHMIASPANEVLNGSRSCLISKPLSLEQIANAIQFRVRQCQRLLANWVYLCAWKVTSDDVSDATAPIVSVMT